MCEFGFANILMSVTVRLYEMSACTHAGLSPVTLSYLNILKNSKNIQYESTNQE